MRKDWDKTEPTRALSLAEAEAIAAARDG